MKKAVDPSALFPPLYARWMKDLLEGPIPDETVATCSDCSMCRIPGVAKDRSDFFYDRRTKCCTYRPTLANFLVGRILADEDPAFASGRESIRDRIRAKVAITPQGVGSSATFLKLFRERALADFGRAVDLRCPHFVDEGDGKCGIWKHRNAVCTTFFCRHTRGGTGLEFWKGAVFPLLSAVEKGITRWCMLEIGIDPKALRVLYPPPTNAGPVDIDLALPDGNLDAPLYRTVWGEWLGREEEFFKECVRRMESLTWNDVLHLCGTEVAVHAEVVRDAYERLVSEDVPERVVRGRFFVVREGPLSTRVWGHSPLDPIEVPNAALAALNLFDGRPTTEVLSAVAPSAGLDGALVRKLVDYGVLEARAA